MPDQFDIVIDDLKEAIKYTESSSISCLTVYKGFDGDVIRTESSTHSGVNFLPLKVLFLEKIIEETDPDKEKFLKKLFSHLKQNLESCIETVYSRITRKKGGYSEYTWWWDTVESSEPIELIDIDKLNKEIDEFSRTFDKND